ncbi:exopolysaccharide biosynthesis polyprenyl glycosylphosphotransferase [Litorihabitans aurantiacus]|uniref:UDP-phosphate galactose phosphotransferase n=1 Tax=Litorihabitans aurantiacus TaxID=1930061 RepID=A0AA37XEP0_9MICO|nr:exopolysaccharide biosynthesis polyprenyl glycosylphosphotransferase [Litorihabitans aurantiacus]GMA31846.1 UDP-phosphate galactose phosphotransferase [Litorihabitans aurantiacus]
MTNELTRAHAGALRGKHAAARPSGTAWRAAPPRTRSGPTGTPPPVAEPTATSAVVADSRSRRPGADRRSAVARTSRRPAWLRGARGWMLVLPVDAAAMLVPMLWLPEPVWVAVTFTAVCLLLLTDGGRYRARLHASFLDDAPWLVRNVLTAAAIVALPIALTQGGEDLLRFFRTVLVAGGLLLLGRLATMTTINIGRRRGWVQHRTVLVGAGEIAGVLARLIASDRSSGLVVSGFVDAPGTWLPGVPRLGDVADLERAVQATGADVLLLADGDLDESEVVRVLDDPRIAEVDKLIVPRMNLLRTRTGLSDRIGPIPVARITAPRLSGFGAATKRVADVVAAALALVLVSPLLAVCAVIIRADGGPVIYRQTRVGRDGATFECLKLRSMSHVTATPEGPAWGTRMNASRITRIGRFIRATSIDELPQLWNVVRGDMSLVGPRPERPSFVDVFSAEHIAYSRRHRVRPGLTGLSQISGLRGDTSIGDRARTDNYYIENWSQYSDLAIAVRTVREVVLARGR